MKLSPTLQRLRDEEDGQSLLYGAGVVVITVALFYGAMDIGLLVLGKIQAQTAADAAALGAAGLKASVHNTRSLAYRAATGQTNLARMQLLRATSLALKGLVDPAAAKPEDFRKAIGTAAFHRENVEMLHDGLAKYNDWVAREDVGPRAVKAAAEIAYRGNLGWLGLNATNVGLIKRNSALPEFDASSGLIGPTSFSFEAIGGIAGKSHATVEPKVNAIGSGLLGYGSQAALTAASTAGPVDAKQAFGKNLKALDPKTGYGVNWYTVRLLAIGAKGERSE